MINGNGLTIKRISNFRTKKQSQKLILNYSSLILTLNCVASTKHNDLRKYKINFTFLKRRMLKGDIQFRPTAVLKTILV